MHYAFQDGTSLLATTVYNSKLMEESFIFQDVITREVQHYSLKFTLLSHVAQIVF